MRLQAALLSIIPIVFCWTWDERTPLDDYVKEKDDTFTFTVLPKRFYEGYVVYFANMTSQTWKTENEVESPVWWHLLSIVVPHKLVYTNASFMYLGRGDNLQNSLPDPNQDDKFGQVVRLALGAGAVGAYLMQIPNQPIFFKDDPSGRGRYEDDAIAYTWRHFVENSDGDPEFLLRMPMTKAAMRAMDTVTTMTKVFVPNSRINKFMIAGASKRGWTTWTTAAMDRRVFAIAPKVLSILNIRKNLRHHYRSLGGWTWLFQEYYNENLTRTLDHPNFQKMADIIDPYMYKERLTMPKLMISASSDEFFLPDDSHYYFKDLEGPKYFWLVENSGHSLNRSPRFNEIWDDMQAFFVSVLTKFRLPQLRWKRREIVEGGTITLWADRKPKSITAYEAITTDGKRRDFRRLVGLPPKPNPIVWQEKTVKDLRDNKFKYKSNKPEVGWKAFFIKVTFDGPGGRILTFSSEVSIIPDTFPFPECYGDGCYGKLV